MLPDFVYELGGGSLFLLILLVTAAVAAALHLLLHTPVLRRIGATISDLAPPVPTLCVTLFALSVTFLANSVWQDEQRARETVMEEARGVRIFNTYLTALTGPSAETLSRMQASYLEAVVAEWPHMAHTGGSAAAEVELSALYRAVIAGLAEGDFNRMLQQRLLGALDNISTARQMRLNLARDSVSAGQWTMVLMLAVLLLTVFSVIHGRTPRSRIAALGIASLAVTIALFVIISHDRPFIGHLAITPQMILDAAATGPRS